MLEPGSRFIKRVQGHFNVSSHPVDFKVIEGNLFTGKRTNVRHDMAVRHGPIGVKKVGHKDGEIFGSKTESRAELIQNLEMGELNCKLLNWPCHLIYT